MARRRTNDEWQELITQFEVGDENATAFCRSRGLSTSNFYKQRSRRASGPSAFVAARRVAPAPTPGSTSGQISVQINDVTIRCDAQTSVAWISELVATVRP